MRDLPNGADLLAEVRRVLSEELAPGLRGEQRYLALLTSAAVAMVERELAEGDTDATDREALASLLGQQGSAASLTRALADAIRSGRFDGDEAVHAELVRETETRVRLANPKALG